MSIVGKIKNNLTRKIPYDELIKYKYKLKKSFRNDVDKQREQFRKSLERINSRKNSEEKPVIVFVCQVPSLWNGMESVYQAAAKNTKVEAVCLALPEKLMNTGYDVTWEKYGENESYRFLKERGYNVINGHLDDGDWFDMKRLNPSYVFLQRPYDIHLPECYRSYTLCTYAKVCYIPYGYDNVIWDSKMTYEFDFIQNLYAIYTENYFYYDQIKNICSTCGWNDKKVFNLGFPRFDLLPPREPNNRGFKTIMWLPRWTTDPSVEATTFFTYKDFIISFFLNHPEFNLICRPHPLMLRNFVSCGIMSEEEEKSFINLFNNQSNFLLDLDGDYYKSFEKADVFISDFTSLLVEEILMDKPVLFTGSTHNFSKFSWQLAKGMYVISNQNEMNSVIEKLMTGIDERKEDRETIARTIYDPSKGNIGEKIVNSLEKDYIE